MSFLDLLFEMGLWSFDAVWLPVLVWTVIALPVYAIQRWTPGVLPHTRYWTTLGLTLSLPIGVIAGAFVAATPASVGGITAVVHIPYVTPDAWATSASSTFSWTVWHSAGALTMVAAMLATLRGMRLIAAARELRCFDPAMMSSAPLSVVRPAARLAEHMGLDDPIRIVVSNTHPSPLTFGWLSPVVVLPQHLLAAPEDLRLALAHEFVHIRRRDYFWHWCEHVVGALFFIHPAVALLRNETSILREITCDADVLASVGDRSRYARLLFRYSTAEQSRGRLAIGILLRENHLKKRIVAMKNLLDFTGLNRSKQIGIVVSITLVTLAVVAVACTDVLVESTSRSSDPAPAPSDLEKHDDAYAVVEQMPELVGGLASLQNHLRYPESAKNAGISGRVIVQFVVDEKGDVIYPEIIHGVGSGLDEAAIEAVRRATFRPGVQDGKPVRVRMSIPITFKLDGDGAPNDVDSVSNLSTDVDRLPEIVGGLQAIQQELKYPTLAKKAGIEGRVIVEFVVTKNGTARDARIVRGVGSGLDDEALRAVQNARFIPAQKDGQPVAMKLTLPLTFRLSFDDNQIIRVEVGSKGEVFLNGRRVEASRLASELRENYSNDDPVVTIRVAQDAPSAVVNLAQEQLRSVARTIDYKVVRP